MKRIALITISMAVSLSVCAHVDWTRTNLADPDMFALYQFDEENSAVGEFQPPADGISSSASLIIGQTTGEPMQIVHDVVKDIFAPHSAWFQSTQILQTETEMLGAGGDVTIEFWFKWPIDLTVSSIEIGFRSSAKLRITRDFDNPDNDQFGVQGTHDDFISAPGFPNWEAVGSEEGSLGVWRHVALTIHSTGIYFDETLQHDVYNEGTIGRIWLNGHATGSAPHTVDLTGLRVHDHSAIIINNIEGGIFVDEVTLWKKDWSGNGTVSNPFSNGRGIGVQQTNVENWQLIK